jgi:hypothetical protein
LVRSEIGGEFTLYFWRAPIPVSLVASFMHQQSGHVPVGVVDEFDRPDEIPKGSSTRPSAWREVKVTSSQVSSSDAGLGRAKLGESIACVPVDWAARLLRRDGSSILPSSVSVWSGVIFFSV